MELENIILKKENHIATVTLNRPPANTWNLGLMKDFEKVLDDVEEDNNIRVVILTGAGEKCFSAGYDTTTDLESAPETVSLGRVLFKRVDCFKKPVIAMINGHALGGGLEIALSCHFRISGDNPKAKIGLTELNLGIIPGWGGTQRLMQIIGRQKALDMILFSKRLTPDEALEAGIFTKVVPAASLMEETVKFAEILAKRPPIAVSGVLQSMSTGIYEGIDAGLEMEAEMTTKVQGTKDAIEGFTAFFEKREPVFKGE